MFAIFVVFICIFLGLVSFGNWVVPASQQSTSTYESVQNISGDDESLHDDDSSHSSSESESTSTSSPGEQRQFLTPSDVHGTEVRKLKELQRIYIIEPKSRVLVDWELSAHQRSAVQVGLFWKSGPGVELVRGVREACPLSWDPDQTDSSREW